MTRVLVCGGRNFNDRAELEDTLSVVHMERGPITILIHGAARGADTMAGEWARKNSISIEAYPAQWDVHGRSAGWLRNKQMLEEGKPDLVVAFKGGYGTSNMVRLAERAGVEVKKIRWGEE